MDWDLRELRFFITAADEGSFTDAAALLYVSQAAVSRTIAALEHKVGDKLLRRLPRGCEPTATGQQLLPQARRVLAEADHFTEFLRTRHQVLRLGYSWAALGRHTVAMQRDWAARHPEVELQLVRQPTASAGLAEGLCEVALIRHAGDDPRFDSVVVGLERRVVAFADDDPQWQRRRSLSMAEIASRTILVDPRSGVTTADLWAGAEIRPNFVESTDTDTWLDKIASGQAVGTTAEATAYHHPRPGVSYRPIKDGPRIAVRLIWRRDECPRALADLIDVITRLYV